MHISWLGNTAIKIQAKPVDTDVTIIIDPYKQKEGNFPRSLTPNVVIYTRGEKDSITLSGNPFVVSTPGEIDTKDVLVTTTQSHNENEIIARIDVEKVSIGHLGLTNKLLTEKQIELLSNIDVLFIAVGHEDSFDVEQALKTINSIEPRIIIPIAFKSENDPKAKEITTFLAEMGAKDLKPEKKVIVRKKDLPEEEVQVMLLEKE